MGKGPVVTSLRPGWPGHAPTYRGLGHILDAKRGLAALRWAWV